MKFLCVAKLLGGAVVLLTATVVEELTNVDDVEDGMDVDVVAVAADDVEVDEETPPLLPKGCCL